MTERTRIDAQHPWPWLEPFTESASRFFNGRDEALQALLRAVLAVPVCVLFGKSGLGKTSLLLAGLFPLLRERQMLPVALRRLEHGAGAAPLSAQLLRALDAAVAASAQPLRWEGPPRTAPAEGDFVAALWEQLHDRQQRLLDDQGRAWSLVFVLDQFEEVFTLQPDEELRRRLFCELGDLLENRLPPTVDARLDADDALLDRIDLDAQRYRFLLSLREDFLPELEAWVHLVPRLGAQRVRLTPMSAEEALQAVRQTGGPLVRAQDAARIVDFVSRQAAADGAGRPLQRSHTIEPALLSLVCASLNADRLALQPPGASLVVDDLEARGSQILDRFYDDAFAALPPPLREPAASWVENELITDGGTRRPFPVEAVDAELRPALAQLVDRRLLRVENTEQGPQVELVHDRLAAVALRHAQTALQRADAAQRLLREKENAERVLLEQRAELEEQRAEQEQRRAELAQAVSRRFRRMNRLLVLAVVAAGAMAVWAWNERQRAHEESRRAQEALAAWRDSALQAQRQYDRWQSAQKNLSTAERKVDQAVQLLKSGSAPDQATELLSEAQRSYASSSLQPASAPQDCPAGRRLYPQVGSEADLAVVERVKPALREAGFNVMKAELLPARKLPADTEVRYFRNAEGVGALAAAAALRRAGLPNVPARLVPGYEDSRSIRPCHYELWLAVGG